MHDRSNVSPTPEIFELSHFVAEQEWAYPGVVEELRAGRKTSHWIWFILPQIAGLGRSAMSQRFSIRSLDEARAYLAHPILGRRLRECAQILVATQGPNADQIFGSLDAMKVRSSMTLFLRAAPDEALFQQVLDQYYDGVPDPLTDALLGSAQPNLESA